MKEKWTLLKKLKSRGLASGNIESPELGLSARVTSQEQDIVYILWVMGYSPGRGPYSLASQPF